MDVAADCLPSVSQPPNVDSQQLALTEADGPAAAGQGTWAEGRVRKVLLGGAIKVRCTVPVYAAACMTLWLLEQLDMGSQQPAWAGSYIRSSTGQGL